MATQKILILDDSRIVHRTIRTMLPLGNFNILEASDGEAGLATICKQHPSLIFLDWRLPKVSGWEVFQKLQAEPELQKIPLIVMCLLKSEVTRNIPEPFDYFEFLEKPFGKKQLMEAMQSAVAKAYQRWLHAHSERIDAQNSSREMGSAVLEGLESPHFTSGSAG